VTTQSPSHIPLLIMGRRNIFAQWPPTAFCEWCGAPAPAGYCGPVQGGAITYPAPQIRFVCEACARRMLKMAPGDLEGHSCNVNCTDELHLEVVHTHDGKLDAMTPEERVAALAAHYAPNGWAVTDLKPISSAPNGITTRWEVVLTPSYLLKAT